MDTTQEAERNSLLFEAIIYENSGPRFKWSYFYVKNH